MSHHPKQHWELTVYLASKEWVHQSPCQCRNDGYSCAMQAGTPVGAPLFKASGLNRRMANLAINRALAGNLEYPALPHDTVLVIRWVAPPAEDRPKRRPYSRKTRSNVDIQKLLRSV